VSINIRILFDKVFSGYQPVMTEMDIETSVYNVHLTRLIAREDFIKFTRRESTKTHTHIVSLLFWWNEHKNSHYEMALQTNWNCTHTLNGVANSSPPWQIFNYGSKNQRPYCIRVLSARCLYDTQDICLLQR
jgi:hypothetical protein